MKKLFLLILTASVFTSCTVKLVPAKSTEAITLLNQIQNDANIAFSSLTFNSAQYLQVDNEIANLITLDKGRDHSGTIVKQDLRIQSSFTEYENEHSKKVTIAKSESNVYTAYFKSFVDPRINSELSLK